jgi:hypothetical protein
MPAEKAVPQEEPVRPFMAFYRQVLAVYIETPCFFPRSDRRPLPRTEKLAGQTREGKLKTETSRVVAPRVPN